MQNVAEEANQIIKRLLKVIKIEMNMLCTTQINI